MLRVLCVVILMAVAVSAIDKTALNNAVAAKVGQSVNTDFLVDADGLAESCDAEAVSAGGGKSASISDLSDVDGAAAALAKLAPADAAFVACMAYDCPSTGGFGACIFNE